MSSRHSRSARVLAGVVGAVLSLVVLPVLAAPAQAAVTTGPTLAVISGEIEQLTLNTPGDVWSGGWVRVGGQDVVLPRNLLLDLPANRMSLEQLFTAAPQPCVDRQESGLGKSDTCNLTGTGGFATIQANRTTAGDVIAGDVFIEKARQILSGPVTYVNVDDGSFRVNGIAGDPAAGQLVRFNDPTGRHSLQRGAGCGTGPNCSADPRFALDADNYTTAFSTGYPVCLPSTVPRTFTDTLNLDLDPTTTTLTAVAKADGTGDILCPDSNRNAQNVASDSRRLAPLQVGDVVTVKGNIETVGGVSFLSVFSTTVGTALSTSGGADQPDYMVLNSMFIDAPAFQRARIRDQFIGATTEADSDVLLWSVHRDPVANQPHEFPLGSVLGCEVVNSGTCRRVLGPNTFRVRHDTLLTPPGAKNAKLSACSQLAAEPIFQNLQTCPGNGPGTENEFAILSPLPHEVQARTRAKTLDMAGNNSLKTVDLRGRDATNGQFLFPMGIGLGGIELPNFAEININALGTPASFDGIPWNLDRRLSPNGCVGGCESTPQPLSPFPFSGLDPRTQTQLPIGPYNDPNYTASPLSVTANRVLSYVDAAKRNFDGDNTVLNYAPIDPPAIGPAPAPPPPGTRGLITDLTPTTGPQAATVVIDGVGFTGSTAVKFGAVPASFSVVSDLQISAVVPPQATSGTVTVVTPSQTLTSAVRFTVVPPPTVTRISPAIGLGGTPVTLTGTGFAIASDVKIGGASTAFTVLSDTSIRTVIPTDAATGPVTVTNMAGSADSPVFQVTAPPPPPVVSGFTPSNGSTGLLVTINGSNFGGAVGVYFGGIAATTFTLINASQVTAIVPDGAVIGKISVAAAGGGGSSQADFQVTAPLPPPAAPVITGFSPPSGPAGTQVTIAGSNFAGIRGVSFGAFATNVFQYVNGTLIATVPVNAVTGPVSVTTDLGGTGVSSTPFTVTPAPPAKPAITSFSPTKGNSGTVVTVTGTNLSGVTGGNIAGIPIRTLVSVAPTKVVFVVGGASLALGGPVAKPGVIRLLQPNGIITSVTKFRIAGPAK